MKHSKLPWDIDGPFIIYDNQDDENFDIVAEVMDENDADFILCACNSHEKLVHALKIYMDEDRYQNQIYSSSICNCSRCSFAREVLREAGEE